MYTTKFMTEKYVAPNARMIKQATSEQERKKIIEGKTNSKTAAIDKAIKAFLPDFDFDTNPAAMKTLRQYVNKHMKELHCCVLWGRSSGLEALCGDCKIPFDVGRREVIIAQDYTVLLYPDNSRTFFPV